MNDRIILVSHLGLATGIKKALEFIVGEQPQLHAIELDEAGIEQFKKKLSLLPKDEQFNSTILVSDIPSGSPGATAYSYFSDSGDVRLLSGMNLPLVLDLVLSSAIKQTEQLIPDAISSAKETIQDYTIHSTGETEDDF